MADLIQLCAIIFSLIVSAGLGLIVVVFIISKVFP